MTGIVEIDELGRRIRKCRLDRRMTLKDVEQVSGLSATHLSEIERGRTSPTIGALVRIARALNRDASYFIEREERTEVAHQTYERIERKPSAGGLTTETLTPGIPGSRMFAYRLLIEPGEDGGVELTPQEIPGEAIYFVRRGTLEAEFGEQRLTLSGGDAVQATFAVPHRIRAASGGTAELIAILTRALDDPAVPDTR
jgi:transcriptional regulator with XRE-family HTH domain